MRLILDNIQRFTEASAFLQPLSTTRGTLK